MPSQWELTGDSAFTDTSFSRRYSYNFGHILDFALLRQAALEAWNRATLGQALSIGVSVQ